MESKARESDSDCVEVPLDPIEDIFDAENADNTNRDQQEMSYFGKTQQLKVSCLRPFQLRTLPYSPESGLEVRRGMMIIKA